jgi:wyosine [tRNA(Phe)-imidazoG37] synthetase (radical SAM superfamily)
MLSRVPEGARRINDIALSGNGEPTSAAEFVQIIELIGRIKDEITLPESIKMVLITNGSLIHRENVQQGLRLMARLNGEVWFKLDRATEKGMSLINDTRTSLDKVRENLTTAIARCPNTWLQTCWFALDGEPPGTQDEVDYLNFLKELLQRGIKPKGVLLYGIARASMQPEAARLHALSTEQIESFATQIRQLDIDVKIAE